MDFSITHNREVLYIPHIGVILNHHHYLPLEDTAPSTPSIGTDAFASRRAIYQILHTVCAMLVHHQTFASVPKMVSAQIHLFLVPSQRKSVKMSSEDTDIRALTYAMMSKEKCSIQQVAANPKPHHIEKEQNILGRKNNSSYAMPLPLLSEDQT